MPTRIPVASIRVERDGEIITAPIGKPFNFTDTELKQINAMDPKAVKKVTTEVEVDEGGDGGDGAPVGKYDGQTVAQLKQVAADRNIDLGDATKRADILAKIEAADQAEAESL